ncbi:MAG: AAA family ATPase [Candidatus Micrarchaeota archaeon]|nr:AAA family ATPase [Candidatus Micrarchaeota archaeon]
MSSPKGGVGKSVIAINLATALQSMGYNVLIIDLDLINPCVGLYMGIQDTNLGFLDVVKKRADLKRSIVPHAPTGVRVLPGRLYANIFTIKDFSPTAKQLRDFFLKVLKLSYDFVIVDTQPGIAYPLPLDLYSEAMLVALPYKSSCIAAVKMEDRYGKVGLKCSLVVNRVRDKKFELSDREIEEMVETPVSVALPEDDKVQEGVAEGVPVELLNRRAPFSRGIMELARMYATRVSRPERRNVTETGGGLLDRLKRRRA